MAKFVILNEGSLLTYDKYDDIPSSFDNLIEFSPDIIPPPHTEDEHRLNAQWESRLQELLKREKK